MRVSFVVKLMVISLCLLLNAVVIAVVSASSIRKLSAQLEEADLVHIPAVRLVTLLDMYHDQMRSIALESTLSSQENDLSRLEELKKELAELRDNAALTIASLGRLNLSADFKSSLPGISDNVDELFSFAEQMIALQVEKNFAQAKTVRAAFNISFEKLGKILEEKGARIQDEANRSIEISEATVKNSKTTMNYLLFGGLAFGLLITVWTVWGFRRQLRNLLSHVSTEAEQLQGSSKMVLTSAQQLSSATSQQSAAIEETVASMEEMSSMLAQTAQQATKSLEYSEIGHTEAAKGRGVMAKMSAAMDEIQTSNSKLDRLVALINDIKERTNVINEIVSETRLLSFNASIEAARAGAQGKGFAVVAEEVGKLAAMSGKAASDIKQLLDSSTTEVTQVVQETQERVQVGKRISDECEAMFNVMKESLEKIDKSVKMIAAATQEQEAGIKQTNTAMTDMSHATQSNSKSVESLTSESTTLASGAHSLHKAVATLQLSMLGGNLNAVSTPETSKSVPKGKAPDLFDHAANSAGAGAGVRTTSVVSAETPISRADSRWRRAS